MEQQKKELTREGGAQPRPNHHNRNRHNRRRSRGAKGEGKADAALVNAPEKEGAKESASRDSRAQGANRSGRDNGRGKQNAPRERSGDGRDRGRGNQNHRNHERDRQGRENAPQTVPESAPRTGKDTFYVAPTLVSSADKLLEDTFLPLHEVDVYDPEAEETARRILDAEGALLFREDTVPAPLVADASEAAAGEDAEERVEVIGVRFKKPGKVYFFAPGGYRLNRGDHAIVETARGAEYGEVWVGNTTVPTSEVVQPLRPVLRAATEEDTKHHNENKVKEENAFRLCQDKIEEHKLEMKLVEAQYTFDNSKLLFYFTSDGRVDFRDLVKDLAGLFRTRIELRQIGIRDEAKMLGGLGTCGRPLCCAGFLSDFVQVSIKMAKEQNLSLNSTKISGCCGRLMCCLRYEHETYEEEIRRTPSVGSRVRTPDGVGEVISNHLLRGTVLVRFATSEEDKTADPPKTYHRDAVTVLHEGRGGKGARAVVDESSADAASDES